MEKSVLDKISKLDIIYYNGWRNGKKGHITDLLCNGIYRFFEEKEDVVGWERLDHQKKEDNPIVCVGIAAYWLSNRNGPETVRQMYKNYTEKKFELFKFALKNDAQAWDWEDDDWRKLFYLKAAERESFLNKKSEALFDYITEYDALKIRPVMENYIKYLNKCLAAYQALSTDEDMVELIDKIFIYFKDEETTKRFLKKMQALDKDEDKIELVKKFKESNLCRNTSKGLWKVLHEAKLYGKGYTNWNQMLNKK